jgi:hypothetical protein
MQKVADENEVSLRQNKPSKEGLAMLEIKQSSRA